MTRLPAADLDAVVQRAAPAWDDLRDARVFITGASGFVGSWLLESLLAANRAKQLGVHVTALVRDRDTFAARFPHLMTDAALRIHVGDVRMADPPTRAFTHIVHSASAATPRMNAEQPDEVVDLIEHGTERMCEEAESTKGTRLLQWSSGSIYGTPPVPPTGIPESFAGRAHAVEGAERFGTAKWRAEQRVQLACTRGVHGVCARVFALFGPRLPLDGQFALGNFMGDALAGRPITLLSDGTAVRSWLYAADLAAWCWVLLTHGKNGAAYNVGSEESYDLRTAASRVAALATPPVSLEFAGSAPATSHGHASHYVPSIALARTELGLDAWTSFDDGIRRMWRWHREDT